MNRPASLAITPSARSEDRASIEAKVAFLRQPTAYLQPVDRVETRETHMSWVFLAGDRAYKLKKPVRFLYLNFSTIAQRAAACRSELRLNRRLAPDIYLDVVPLTGEAGGLAIGGAGEPVDWLVVMRRLDPACMLDRRLIDGRLRPVDIDRVMDILAHFYRRARPVFPKPSAYLIGWRRALALNRHILLDGRLGLPAGLVRRIDRVQREALKRLVPLLVSRLRTGCIRDGHGDLRAEHVWIGDGIRIIDALEFSALLRASDPLEEIAALSVECEALGAAWVGTRMQRRLPSDIGRGAPQALCRFYRCYRASLRARLAIAHLLDPRPRTPDKWPRVANTFLQLAAKEARLLERDFTRRGDRRASGPRAGAV